MGIEQKVREEVERAFVRLHGEMDEEASSESITQSLFAKFDIVEKGRVGE